MLGNHHRSLERDFRRGVGRVNNPPLSGLKVFQLDQADIDPFTLARVFDLNGNEVVATVRDAGCGFDPAAATARAGGGQGLAGMRDRAESIGGEVRLESAPGAGTTLALTLPLGKGGIE